MIRHFRFRRIAKRSMVETAEAVSERRLRNGFTPTAVYIDARSVYAAVTAKAAS